MGQIKRHAVTGAFSYTGKYIARRLLAQGQEVVTLTNRVPRGDEFGGRVKAFPFNFDEPEALAADLAGVDTLYNSYWVRFPRGESTFEAAVENTKTLIRAAKAAGVRRFVHVSICKPTEGSPLAYYRGKARLEHAVKESGLSHAILRPTVIFGKEDILVNNIAWMLRTFPFFAVPGDGEYRLQPIFVEDMARLAVEAGERDDDVVFDAVGPEVYTFNELARLMARALGRPARLVHLPPRLVHLLTAAMGPAVGDVILTWEEILGLMDDLLVSRGPATGTTKFSEWLKENAGDLGRRYSSEVARHFAKESRP